METVELFVWTKENAECFVMVIKEKNGEQHQNADLCKKSCTSVLLNVGSRGTGFTVNVQHNIPWKYLQIAKCTLSKF